MLKVIKYVCPICGNQSDKDHEVCPACSSHTSYLTYNQNHFREDTKMGHLDPSGENGVDGMSYLKGWNDKWKSMENDAVVGYIRESEGTYWVGSEPDEKIHGKVGDKVKLIIVKEE